MTIDSQLLMAGPDRSTIGRGQIVRYVEEGGYPCLKDGDEKDCKRCGQPAIFESRPLKPSTPFQVGDYVPPAAEYRDTAGWTCTVCRQFEPLT